MTNNIYLKTAFAFMACDGEIVKEEIDTIKEIGSNGLFSVENIDDEIGALVQQLNQEGKQFMKSYLSSLVNIDLSAEDSLKLLKVAVRTIFADNNVAYSEVKFFRAVRKYLTSITDKYILDNIPEIEDFWLESDFQSANIEKDYFDSVEMPQFNLKEINAPK